MAIAIGTTSRQLSALGQWVISGVLITGMLCWWSCGYYNWAAFMGSLSLAFVLFLTWRITTGETGFLGNRIYVAISGPAIILAVHVVTTGLGKVRMEYHALSGSMNMSMLTQLVLLGMGVLVMQNLFVGDADNAGTAGKSRTKMQSGVAVACGIGMVLGASTAILSGRAEAIRGGLALLGFAGIAVMIAPLWRQNPAGTASLIFPTMEISGISGPGNNTKSTMRRVVGLIWLASAGAALAGLAVICPRFEIFLTFCISSAVLLLAGILFRGMRARLLVFGSLVAATAAVLGFFGGVTFPHPSAIVADVVGPFGRGEEAFALRGLWGGSTGLAVLSSTTGMVGLLWMMLAATFAWIVQFVQARKSSPAGQFGIIAWSLATALATAAMFSPGGLFVPVFTLSAAFTWALMPTMLGLTSPRRKGISLLIVMICMVILLGLVRQEGLLVWSIIELGGGDEIMHAGVSFLAALVIAWHMGIKKYWMGLLGILIVVAAGGLGEVAQKIASTRQMEFKDWFFDSVGCVAAVLVYLPAIACKLCESSDVKPANQPSRYDQYG